VETAEPLGNSEACARPVSRASIRTPFEPLPVRPVSWVPSLRNQVPRGRKRLALMYVDVLGGETVNMDKNREASNMA